MDSGNLTSTSGRLQRPQGRCLGGGVAEWAVIQVALGASPAANSTLLQQPPSWSHFQPSRGGFPEAAGLGEGPPQDHPRTRLLFQPLSSSALEVEHSWRTGLQRSLDRPAGSEEAGNCGHCSREKEEAGEPSDHASARGGFLWTYSMQCWPLHGGRAADVSAGLSKSPNS